MRLYQQLLFFFSTRFLYPKKLAKMMSELEIKETCEFSTWTAPKYAQITISTASIQR